MNALSQMITPDNVQILTGIAIVLVAVLPAVAWAAQRLSVAAVLGMFKHPVFVTLAIGAAVGTLAAC